MPDYQITTIGYSKDFSEIGEAFPVQSFELSGEDDAYVFFEKLLKAHKNYTGEFEPTVFLRSGRSQLNIVVEDKHFLFSDANDLQRQNLQIKLSELKSFLITEYSSAGIETDSEKEISTRHRRKDRLILVMISVILATALIQGIRYFVIDGGTGEFEYTPVTEQSRLEELEQVYCAVYTTGDKIGDDVIAVSSDGNLYFYAIESTDLSSPASFALYDTLSYTLGTQEAGVVIFADGSEILPFEKDGALLMANVPYSKAKLEVFVSDALLRTNPH